jgi:hypothetical protein
LLPSRNRPQHHHEDKYQECRHEDQLGGMFSYEVPVFHKHKKCFYRGLYATGKGKVTVLLQNICEGSPTHPLPLIPASAKVETG